MLDRTNVCKQSFAAVRNQARVPSCGQSKCLALNGPCLRQMRERERECSHHKWVHTQNYSPSLWKLCISTSALKYCNLERNLLGTLCHALSKYWHLCFFIGNAIALLLSEPITTSTFFHYLFSFCVPGSDQRLLFGYPILLSCNNSTRGCISPVWCTSPVKTSAGTLAKALVRLSDCPSIQLPNRNNSWLKHLYKKSVSKLLDTVAVFLVINIVEKKKTRIFKARQVIFAFFF